MRQFDVVLGEELDVFVDTMIAAGRYTDASEVVRAGLRALEQQELRTEALRREIQKGLDSGISNRTVDEILAEAKKQAGIDL